MQGKEWSIQSRDQMRSAFDRVRKDGDTKTVREIFEIAKAGGEDFEFLNLVGEIKELVKSGSVRLDETFDEDTGLKNTTNRSNSIMGAVTEGRDWRRLTNLSIAGSKQYYNFFLTLEVCQTISFKNCKLM